jgi:NitT/TauT family transport system permease protein
VRAFGIPVFLLPAPSVIWTETLGLGPVLVDHLVATLTTVLLGFAFSIVVSFPIGVLIGYSAFFANAIYPLLVLTQSIPKVALAPILVVLLGAGEMPRVVVTFLVAFFPLVIAIATGLMSVPPELVELGRSLKASRLQELLRIRLPWSVPVLFGGLKVAIALSVVGAVVGEFVAAERGLGYLINSSMAFFRTPIAFGAMILLSVLGILLFQSVVLAERLLFPWSASAEFAPSA